MHAFSLLLVIAFFALLAWGQTRESFVVAKNDAIDLTNTGNNPWERHPIASVPYLQLQPAFQRGLRHHANAAYFEMDNYEFDIAMQKAFALPCGQFKQQMQQGWGTMQSPAMTNVPDALKAEYPKMIAFLQNALRDSKHLSDIQIVHDRWLGYATSSQNNNVFMVRLEALLYRLGKFQGKHVTMTVVIDLNVEKNKYTVVQTNVEGVVSEDVIGMFPVVPKEYGVSGADFEPVPENPLTPYTSVLLDEVSIRKAADSQQQKLNRELASKLNII